MSLLERLPLYGRLIRLDKPIGSLLLLWPTLTALWIATYGRPTPVQIGVFMLGTFLMRSAGCAINDYADRRFDGAVKRTATRVLPAGAIRPREALAVAATLALSAAALLFFLHPAAFWWALAAVAAAASYPFCKRFFDLPQSVLGVAFSFGIFLAFAGVQGRVPAAAWWLFSANLFWVVAYDTEYAMVDRDDDVRIGLRSAAILFGRADVAAVGVCYAVSLALLVVVGKQIGASWPYYLGLGAALACAAYHLALIRDRDRDACFRAFKHNQWLGLAVFLGVVCDLALR